MAVLVVDGFEVVQIREEKGETLPEAFGAFDLLGEVALQVAPVGDASHAVYLDLSSQPLPALALPAQPRLRVHPRLLPPLGPPHHVVAHQRHDQVQRHRHDQDLQELQEVRLVGHRARPRRRHSEHPKQDHGHREVQPVKDRDQL